MAGRKSTAALSVVASREIDGRPQAPADLTDRQREIWDRTVANEAADVFKTAALQQLLADYCRHVTTSEYLTKQIDAATIGPNSLTLADMAVLVRLRDCETKASADKATKLRLTNQSRYTPGAAGTAAKKGATGSKPWQSVG